MRFAICETRAPTHFDALGKATGARLYSHHSRSTMPMTPRRVHAVLLAASLATAVAVAAQTPVPPVKPGLWQTKMSQLDATGKEVPSPELAMLSRMPPATRAQMAAAMKARGVQMPDENGMMKAC